jgi:predicted nucleic acid-binding protein
VPDRAFFDTSVLIYALAQGDPRSAKAEVLLSAGGVLSVQVLNEFVAVARRKMAMPWPDIKAALKAIRLFCPSPLPITVETHEAALEIAERYKYGFYDALVLASAIDGGCSVIYSEDFHDGQRIHGLAISNPFS